jgi:hypothetical protein
MSSLEDLRGLHERKPELVKTALELVKKLVELAKQWRNECNEAKRVMAEWVKNGKKGKKPEDPKNRSAIPPSAQWQNLRTVVASAACLAEVENYLDYQAGRKVWDKEAVDDHLKPKLTAAAKRTDGKGDDMDALKLFVGYLVRAVSPYAKKQAGQEDNDE